MFGLEPKFQRGNQQIREQLEKNYQVVKHAKQAMTTNTSMQI